ncbi:MAG: hypothetical protein DHS20C05_14200 [Hyphococcus sp.]|nr:MAG: hypothetical protein DHS20C05_14200 [Marinicaulis sp.]
MVSVTAIFGIFSLVLVLGCAIYLLRKLGAEDVGHMLAAITAFGFIAAIVGAVLS